jgi:hypothetical protein
LPKIGQTVPKKDLTIDDLPNIYKKIYKDQPEENRPDYETVSIVLENIIRKVLGEEELKVPTLGQIEELDSSIPVDTASSSDSKRMLLPLSKDGAQKNLLKQLTSEDGSDTNKYMERKALID